MDIGGLYFLLEPILVEEIMTRDPDTITPDASAGHAAFIMVGRRFGAGRRKRTHRRHCDGDRFAAVFRHGEHGPRVRTATQPTGPRGPKTPSRVILKKLPTLSMGHAPRIANVPIGP